MIGVGPCDVCALVLSGILDRYLKPGSVNIPDEAASQLSAKVNREENSAYNHISVSSCFRHCSVCGFPGNPVSSTTVCFLEVQQRDSVVSARV